jgi:PhoH-like ATPase
VLKEI